MGIVKPPILTWKYAYLKSGTNTGIGFKSIEVEAFHVAELLGLLGAPYLLPARGTEKGKRGVRSKRKTEEIKTSYKKCAKNNNVQQSYL